MEVKDIPLTRETVLDHEVLPDLGPVTLNVPPGQALCFDVVATTMITGQRTRGDKFIAIVAVTDQYDGALLGTLTQFTAQSARNFAASLLAAADQIDGGGERQ